MHIHLLTWYLMCVHVTVQSVGMYLLHRGDLELEICSCNSLSKELYTLSNISLTTIATQLLEVE